MASKAQAKKKAGGGEQAQGQDEELLKHPVMMYPPFTPVMVTAQRVPFHAEPDENSQVVGEARMKEVVPVLHSQGPWLMTVANYEEAWFQAAWVAEVEQDAPDQYFKDQQVIHDAFEERADQTEEGEPVKTETRPYMEMADGYGMMVMPNTTEELFVQAYAELIYAFEPNAELMGTYKHIMNVFSPDTLVELEDYITLPAEIEAGEKTGEGPLMPEDRERARNSPDKGAEQQRADQAADAARTRSGKEEPKSLGSLAQVSPVVVQLASQSWGVDLSDVEIVEDGELAAGGRRGAVADGQTVRLAPGASSDVEILLEELAHIVQHRNASSGKSTENAATDGGNLEVEASKAVESAMMGRKFEIKGVASQELNAKDGEVTGKGHKIIRDDPRNEFKGKTFEQIEQLLIERGYEKKGPDPVNGKGQYVDPETGTKYFFDKGGQYKAGFEPPHIDVWHNGAEPKEKWMLDGDIWVVEG